MVELNQKNQYLKSCVDRHIAEGPIVVVETVPVLVEESIQGHSSQRAREHLESIQQKINTALHVSSFNQNSP
jgi:hypothetical protein